MEMNLMNSVRQMCVGLITPRNDWVTGHNTFNAGLLKPLPVLHR